MKDFDKYVGVDRGAFSSHSKSFDLHITHAYCLLFTAYFCDSVVLVYSECTSILTKILLYGSSQDCFVFCWDQLSLQRDLLILFTDGD